MLLLITCDVLFISPVKLLVVERVAAQTKLTQNDVFFGRPQKRPIEKTLVDHVRIDDYLIVANLNSNNNLLFVHF